MHRNHITTTVDKIIYQALTSQTSDSSIGNKLQALRNAPSFNSHQMVSSWSSLVPLYANIFSDEPNVLESNHTNKFETAIFYSLKYFSLYNQGHYNAQTMHQLYQTITNLDQNQEKKQTLPIISYMQAANQLRNQLEAPKPLDHRLNRIFASTEPNHIFHELVPLTRLLASKLSTKPHIDFGQLGSDLWLIQKDNSTLRGVVFKWARIYYHNPPKKQNK